MIIKNVLLASHDEVFSSSARTKLAAAGFTVVVVDELSVISPLGHFSCIQLAIIDATFGDDDIVNLFLRLREDRTRIALLRLLDSAVEIEKMVFQCQMICSLRREQIGVDLRLLQADASSRMTEMHYSFDASGSG